MEIKEKLNHLPAWAVPAAIFFLALAVRLAYIYFSGFSVIPDPDTSEYLAYAENMLKGLGYTDGQWRAFRAPGYPFFAAAVYYIFGPSIPVLKAAQALLSSAVPVLIYYIGLRTGGRLAGLVAGFFACFYFGLVLEPYHLVSEAVFTPLFALSVLLLLKTEDHWAYAPAAGAALGLTTLSRPVGLVILAAAGLWLFIKYPPRRALGYTLAAALALCVVMAPWWVRNYRVFHAFVPVCLETGFVLKHTRVPEAILQFNDHLPELQRDRQNAREAIAYLKTREMSELLRGSVIRFLTFLHPFMPSYDFTYALILPFWLYGIYLVLKTRNTNAMLLFSMFIYFPVAFVFCGTARHRHSVGPYFILLAALAAAALFEKYRNSAARRPLLYALAAWCAINVGILLYPDPVRLFLKRMAGV
ncbi:MAG: hypothetical protein A2X29_11490 [Elusimicrobia bacterium GWA2_64_40]|nr:MAG: hypothetical protein A2X29_11490 [Elusimicrobia bacterium GWA2_64_40]OGR64929.1 MAG: hypothetical protein A2X30_03930 [Elusimicrobia bacterium GWB2_63_16]HAN05465.1 hypothetical protein [Elusimicrobiota bacterium]